MRQTNILELIKQYQPKRIEPEFERLEGYLYARLY